MQPLNDKQYYFIPFLFSVLIHAVIIAFILFMVVVPQKNNFMMDNKANKPIKIVSAVTVNQAAVEKEIARLQKQHQQRKELREQKERYLRKKMVELEKQKIRIEKSEAALSAQQKWQQAQALKIKRQQKLLNKQQALIKRQKAEQILHQKTIAEQKAEMHTKQLASVVNKYTALIKNAIFPNWIVSNKQKKLSADVLINLAPNGVVLNASIEKSSGSAAFDRSAVAAIYKSSPLPVPKDVQAFAIFKHFKLTLHPKNIVVE